MKYQTKYYITGTVFLGGAMLFATIIPPLVAYFNFFYVEDYVFVVFKFFMFAICGVYYLFSPKYYKEQLKNMFIALLLYILFVLHVK